MFEYSNPKVLNMLKQIMAILYFSKLRNRIGCSLFGQLLVLVVKNENAVNFFQCEIQKNSQQNKNHDGGTK